VIDGARNNKHTPLKQLEAKSPKALASLNWKGQQGRINASKGFIVAFSFTKGAHEEVPRVKGKGLDIKLARVEDLLLGKVKI
jgi:hypothetical protein